MDIQNEQDGKESEVDEVSNGHHDHEKRGGFYWYAVILSRFSVVVLVAILVVSGGCAATVFILHEFPTFEEPTAGFQTSRTTIQSRLISLENFYSSSLLHTTPHNFIEFQDEFVDDDIQRRRRQAETVTQRPMMTASGVQICRYVELDYYAKLVFEASNDGDLFTAVAIKAMCRAEEKKMRSHPRFSEACYVCGQAGCPASWSLGSYIALLHNKTSCDDIDNADVVSTRYLLHRCSPYYIQWYNSSLCSDPPCEIDTPEECLQFDAVHNILHFLTPADFAMEIDKNWDAHLKNVAHIVPVHLTDDDLLTIYLDRFHRTTYKAEGVTLKALDFQIKFELFDMFLFSDIVFVAIGFVLVVLLIWIYTRSLIITLAACLNFVLSLFFSYFFYFVVFRRNFFPFVNIVSAALVIGVGADDTFVYVDLWRKSLSDHRSAELRVIVQDALYHASFTMLVTSVTTAGSLYASIISNITAVKCFGLFAGTAIMMNFFLTLTLLPAVIIIQHRLMTWYHKRYDNDDTSSNSKFGRCCYVTARIRKLCFTPLRIFFKRILPSAFLKQRYIWLIVCILFGALGIGGALVTFIYPGLQLPSSSEFQILEEDNYLEQWDTNYKDRFKYSIDSGSRMRNHIFIGIKAVETGDTWDPYDKGKLVLDNSFDFSTKEHQEWMRQFCEDLRKQEFYYAGASANCFIESLIYYMDRPCVIQQTGADLSPCCNESTFPYEESVFDTCLRACSARGYCDWGVRFNAENDQFAAIYISFQSTTFVSFDFKTMDKYWKDISGWMDGQMQSAPETLKGGWIISAADDQLYFYDLQNSLATGTPFALGITLVIVMIILLCTILNIVLAFYAILTVAFAVFVTIGSLVLLGWELNIFESIILILAVGLCVDFTLHYGVAYRLAPHTKRNKRTEFSAQTMGGAISVAAFSTFLAGAFMLFANINAYFQLGLFLMLVMCISWAFSTFFFQSLCRVLGPQSSFGDLTSFAWCKSCKRDRTHTVELPLPPSQTNVDPFVVGQANHAFDREEYPRPMGTMISDIPIGSPVDNDFDDLPESMFDLDQGTDRFHVNSNETHSINPIWNPAFNRFDTIPEGRPYGLDNRPQNIAGSKQSLTNITHRSFHTSNESLETTRTHSTVRTVRNPLHATGASFSNLAATNSNGVVRNSVFDNYGAGASVRSKKTVTTLYY